MRIPLLRPETDQYMDPWSDVGLSLDPMNRNRSVYAGANPITNTDPWGHEVCVKLPIIGERCTKWDEKIAAAVDTTTKAITGDTSPTPVRSILPTGTLGGIVSVTQPSVVMVSSQLTPYPGVPDSQRRAAVAAAAPVSRGWPWPDGVSSADRAHMKWLAKTYKNLSTESRGYQKLAGSGICAEGQALMFSASGCAVVGGESGIGFIGGGDVGLTAGSARYAGVGVMNGRGAYSAADYRGTYNGISATAAYYGGVSVTGAQGNGCGGQLVSPALVTLGVGLGAGASLHQGHTFVSESC